MASDVKEAEEGQILNGNGSGENFTGINAWSGVQTQSAIAGDLFATYRKAITKARTVGRVNPNGIVVNPADAEAIDLAKDGESRYYFGGPFMISNKTVWGCRSLSRKPRRRVLPWSVTFRRQSFGIVSRQRSLRLIRMRTSLYVI